MVCGIFVCKLSHENVCEVSAVDAEKCSTLQTAEILLRDCEYKADNADEEENDRIVKSGNIDRHGRNDRACAEDEYDVEDVGTDNVSECQIAFVLSCGNDGRYELGQRSADGNDGKTDERLAHAEVFRNDRRVVYDEITAEDDTDNAEDDHFDGHRSGNSDTVVILLFRDFAAFDGFDSTTDLPIHIERKKNEENDTAPKTDGELGTCELFKTDGLGVDKLCAESDDAAKHCGDQNGEGNLSFDSGCIGFDGTDQCTCTENDEQIENVGAEDVTDRDVVLSGNRRADADGSLRQTCTESNDGKSDDDRRNLEELGNCRASFYKDIRADNEQCEAGNEP